MKQTDLAYLAGIIDGEGCISIFARNRPGHKYPDMCLRVAVNSTDEWLCQYIRFSFGGFMSQPKYRANCKPIWEWRLERGKARDFLELILPYLHLKRPQAELAIKFQNSKGRSTNGLTEEERALEETQKILMQSLKRPSTET